MLKALPLALALVGLAVSPALAEPVPGQTHPPFGAQTAWPALDMFVPVAGELQSAGVAWTRFDLNWWSNVESAQGVYDFETAQDPSWGLWDSDWGVAQLSSRGINVIGLLCYGNPLYDQGRGPYTQAGREAFGEYAYQAALRYKDDIHYWEIWNEPNLEQYWGATPNAEDYTLLTAEATARIRQADPNAKILGGVVSEMDLEFLEDCFQHGLLEAVDIVTVHPYRDGVDASPESAIADFEALRTLIDQYTVRNIEIWVSEWGYNRAWASVNANTQAAILSRMLISNFANGIGLTIWFSGHPYDGWGLIDGSYSRQPAWTAMAMANEMLANPVEAVPDPFAIELSPRDELSQVAVFRRSWDHTVVALWRATWPPVEGEPGISTTVRLKGARGVSVSLHDGATGASLSASVQNSGMDRVVSNLDIPGHVIYMELTNPDTSLDADGDGLPDFWETVYYLDPNDPEGENGAQGDPDADDVPNIIEWQRGTDPRSPNQPVLPAGSLTGLCALGSLICAATAHKLRF